MKSTLPKISVCIPVYKTEAVLERCIKSAIRQAEDFSDFEIVVVNDGSKGRDEKGLKCRKIVSRCKKLAKKVSIPINYHEHSENLGLFETRRTGVENARGTYICILDSDDELLPGALKNMYQAAVSCKDGIPADIVQARTEVSVGGDYSAEDKSIEDLKQLRFERFNLLVEGVLNGREVFDAYTVKKTFNGVLWAKLIRRETYLNALSYIPFSHCVMAEDILQTFFITYEAKKYVGINTPVYRYSVDTGISSMRKIDDLSSWRKICSTAEVFTSIFCIVNEMEEEGKTFTEEELSALRLQSRSYLVNNIETMRKNVIPELQTQARSILCEYWGEDFVSTMEKSLDSGNCID